MSAAKFRIYEGIVCVEMPSRTGHMWWDQGYQLGYTPLPVQRIGKIQYGVLHGNRRPVLAAHIMTGGGMQWVAVNLPRSDTFALKSRGLWSAEIEEPYSEKPKYTPWPEKL